MHSRCARKSRSEQLVCKDEAVSAAAASGPIGLDFGRCAEFGEGVIRPLLSGQGQPERMVRSGVLA
jgi:hypothetical protein